MIRTFDEWGTLQIDDQGYAHRGPDYAARASSPEVRALWTSNGVGGFRSVLPVNDPRWPLLVGTLAGRFEVGADDDYPPEARPEWLQGFAHVKGTLASAPLDMAGRLDQVVNALKADGWTVVVRSVGTDFSGPFGLPRPKDQPLDILLDRQDRTYTADDAEAALKRALASVNVDYSPTGAWMHELKTEVVEPSIADAKADVKASTPWIMVGAGVVLALLLRR